MDIDKVNRLRKMRDEIEKLIDEELYKSTQPSWVPDPNPYPPIYPLPIYIPPVFPKDKRPYHWEITWTC